MKNKEQKKISNISDLRDDLLNVYTNLIDGEIGIREAKARNSTASTILKSATIQMEYNVYTKSTAKIPFLEVK